MLRQASSRNQRSKGFKIKYVLQICLLVAICIWLLYQVKHSYDKKRAMIERRSNILRTNVDKKEDFFKFGRKFVPQTDEPHKDVENDESQEEEIEENRDAKQEESTREIEDKEAKDDDIDEHDQDKDDEEESEHLFESTEEEEKHINDKRSNDEENRHGEVDVFDKQEHDGSTQEAREENYKRDDVSSAVAHDDRAAESETGASNIDVSKGSNDTKIDVINSDIAEKEVLKSESVTSGTDEGTKNDSIQENSREITEASANATSETVVNSTVKLDDFVNKVSVNETAQINNGTTYNSTTDEHKSEQQANFTNLIEMPKNSSTSNATMLSDINMDSTQIQGIRNDTRTSNEDKTGLQSLENITYVSANNTTEGDDKTTAVDEQKSEISISPKENKNATTPYVNEFRNATQDDSDILAHDGVTEEERNSRIDLSTLPTIQTEVSTTSDDEAA